MRTDQRWLKTKKHLLCICAYHLLWNQLISNFLSIQNWKNKEINQGKDNPNYFLFFIFVTWIRNANNERSYLEPTNNQLVEGREDNKYIMNITNNRPWRNKIFPESLGKIRNEKGALEAWLLLFSHLPLSVCYCFSHPSSNSSRKKGEKERRKIYLILPTGFEPMTAKFRFRMRE